MPQSQMYLLMAISFIIGIIVQAFFCLTLVKTLRQIKPENQFIKPAMVWLLLIPVVNIFWIFIVVIRMARSISEELISRDYEVEENPGYTTGMIYAALALAANIPMPLPAVGVVAIIAFIFFVQYWMKINWYKKVLEGESSTNVSEENQ